MSIYNSMKKSFALLLLFTTLNSNADVFINVGATIVVPVCNISSDNNGSSLQIGFDTMNREELNNSIPTRNFSIYLSDCDFNKDLSINMTPSNGGTLIYNGKKILATSTNGLGIDFNDMTSGSPRSLEVAKAERIYPVQINTNRYRIDLQALLVSTVPLAQLNLGRFTSAMSISLTYN